MYHTPPAYFVSGMRACGHMTYQKVCKCVDVRTVVNFRSPVHSRVFPTGTYSYLSKSYDPYQFVESRNIIILKENSSYEDFWNLI